VTGQLKELRGARLYRRYERTGDLETLHAAVRVFRAILPGGGRRRAGRSP
jgi:hypothetical protein